ncbi:MAG: hypothetical protein WAW96_11925 [Alphaproteobacteria bacterium]
MMIRLVSMSYIALVAGLVFGLYHVKLETQALQKQKAELAKNIEHANADINMLQAEWANRTAPDNLKRLVAEHLPAMRPTEPTQMLALAKIPMRLTPATDDQIDELLSMVELRPSAREARHPAL